MKNEEIGKGLLKHAKTEGLTVRGALEDLFPYIYEVSNRMSTRKVSDWLKNEHDITISYGAIAKALQKSEVYIQQTASKFYGDAIALDFYIPKAQPFTGLDVLGSRSLCNVLRIEERLDDMGILTYLENVWFSLPEKYRDACMVVMREQQKQGNEEGE